MGGSRLLALVLAASTLVACSDDEVASYNPADLTFETAVSASVVAPAQDIQVTCTVSHVNDGVVDVPTVVLVTPADAADVVGHVVTARKVGVLEVACALAASPDALDPTPEKVLVTQNAAAAVETLLDPASIPAGDVSTVTCRALNQAGQAVQAPTVVSIEPEEGAALSDHSITGEKVGSYSVTCALADVTSVRDASPAQLTVTAGEPAKVTTVLPTADTPSGSTMDVECEVEDAYGNPITGVPTSVASSPVDGVTISEHKLSAGKTGAYEITCSVAGKAGVEEVPATLTVTGGKPKQIDLVADPEKAGYAVSDEVTFSWTVTDAFGNVLDVPVAFTAPGAGVTKKADKVYTLDTEGAHTFTAAVESDAQVTDSLTLMVDATAPTIVITWPERGQTLTGDKAVVVKGKVTDAVSGVKQITVNGGIVTSAADGTFQYTMQAAHAMNAVLAEASDQAGNASKATVAYYFSTDYMPYQDAVADDVALDESLRMYLGQDVIDDGVHDPAHVDDLATLVEILIGNVDLTQLGIGEVFKQTIPVLSQSLGEFDTGVVGKIELLLSGDAVITVTITSIKLSNDPSISLTSVEGGLHMEGELPKTAGQPGLLISLKVGVGFALNLDAMLANVAIGSATVTPTLQSDTAATIDDVSFDTTILISKTPGNPLQVSTTGIVPKMTGLAIDPIQNAEIAIGDVKFTTILGPSFTLPLGSIPMDWLFGGIGDLLGGFATPLLDTLVPLLGQLLGPVLDGPASDAIESALQSVEVDQDIDLPDLLGNGGSTVNLRAGLSSVKFTPKGGTLGLRSGVWSEDAISYDPLGSLLRDQCMLTESGQFAFTETSPMEIGLEMDLLNEVLHAVWWNGYFDMAAGPEELAELSEEIASYGVKDLLVTFLLPPVLTDCNNKGLLRLQLGDGLVEVKMSLLGLDVEATLYVSLELDASITADGDALGVKINGVTLFQVEIVEVNDTFKGNEAELEGAIKAILLPQIEKLTGDSLGSFPIPSLDLSGVVPGVPPGTAITIGDLGVGKLKGFLLLQGDLK